MALADGKGTRQGRKEGGCREGGEPGGQGEGEERKGQAEERPAAKLGVYVERRRQGIRSSGDVTALSSVVVRRSACLYPRKPALAALPAVLVPSQFALHAYPQFWVESG